MFKLAPLPYAYDSLEPYIDAQTMQLHHDKHHQKYVDELNAALKDHPKLQEHSLEELLVDIKTLPEAIREKVRNNGGGHYNHTFFWQILKKNNGQLPKGELLDAIVETFGSFSKFQELFNETAKKVFGSGWAWLCMNSKQQLVVISTPNQDCPVMLNLVPIVGLDVWEHAYYLHYQNKRPDYINAFWQVINWSQVQEYYKRAKEICG